jgi:hypothetical protein
VSPRWSDLLERRIAQAARYVPLEDLCLSPQCGFSSTHHGNKLTETRTSGASSSASSTSRVRYGVDDVSGGDGGHGAIAAVRAALLNPPSPVAGTGRRCCC